MEYDVVVKAETSICALRKDKYNKNFVVTNSQIRKFLTAVNIIKNKSDVYKIKNENSKILNNDIVAEIKFLKVNIFYQAAKANNYYEKEALKEFIEKTDLEKIILDIGNDRLAFEKFCKYVEALVAFHKYYNKGRD